VFAPHLKRRPLGSRVRILLGALILAAACDPARVARFEISPASPSRQPDSSLIAQAREIADRFATQDEMTKLPLDDLCTTARYFTGDSVGARPVGLIFCLLPTEHGIEFQISEAITSSWGPKGNALRSELLDTLISRFGVAAVKHK